ncbi:putative ATP synthase F0 subunit beta [Magnetofaba australis IT-1]|uniref:ATP synthase subunit b n=2 Tax=Magnetofaba TaxID=1472292 RepID=A0A1Y2K7D5_9PROT|nr:putative ATP synthase F0 subunit beta [Magnetofaba australis IT-1]
MFWVIVSFVALLFLLRKYVVPAVNDVLDARAKRISDEIEAAENSRKEAERLLEEHRTQLAEARANINQMMEQAQKDATANREKAMAELDADLSKKKDAAMAEIDTARKKAMSEIRGVAVDVAMEVAEKLIAKSVDKKQAESLANEAIEKIGEAKDQVH